MSITSRSNWNARSPKAPVTQTSWGQRTHFKVHHSAGPQNQTVRAIQDYHMDSDQLAPGGANDIGYNFLIDSDGNIFEGRSWLGVGAHAAPHNTSAIGVCVIGSYGSSTPSNAALESLQWLYAEANRRAGKTLSVSTHRDVNPTECPGDALHSWVHSELGSSSGEPPPDNGGGGSNPSGWTERLIMSLPTLQQGSSGAAVGRAQSLLAAAGHTPSNSFSGATPDRDFGPGTRSALAAFQKANNVRNSVNSNGQGDGILGRYSWEALVSG